MHGTDVGGVKSVDTGVVTVSSLRRKAATREGETHAAFICFDASSSSNTQLPIYLGCPYDMQPRTIFEILRPDWPNRTRKIEWASTVALSGKLKLTVLHFFRTGNRGHYVKK
jgi:hypothetical protein